MGCVPLGMLLGGVVSEYGRQEGNEAYLAYEAKN